MDRKSAVVAFLARINEGRPFPETTGRSRTGSQIHLGSAAGGSTYCGIRLWSPVPAEKLTAHARFCEKCFGSHVFREVTE